MISARRQRTYCMQRICCVLITDSSDNASHLFSSRILLLGLVFVIILRPNTSPFLVVYLPSVYQSDTKLRIQCQVSKLQRYVIICPHIFGIPLLTSVL